MSAAISSCKRATWGKTALHRVTICGVIETNAGCRALHALLRRVPGWKSTSVSGARRWRGRVANFDFHTGVCHRDLKLENWLFDSPAPHTATLRLVDFGLARVFGPLRPDLSKTRSKTNFDERVGSAYYCAPEVLEGIYDRRCDLWSLGVIAYMLFSGTPPFWGRSDKEILKRYVCRVVMSRFTSRR